MTLLRTIAVMVSTTLNGWLRSRSYLGSAAASAVLVVAAPLLSELSGGEGVRVLVDFGLLFVALATTLSITSLVIVNVSSDMKHGDILTLATRPVPRAAIVVARAIAAMIAVVLSNVLLGAVLAAATQLIGGTAPGRVFAASLFLSLEGWIVVGAAIAMVFGSSAGLSAVVTSLVFLVGRLASAASQVRNNPVLEVIANVLPRFDRFSLAAWAEGGDLPADLWMRFAYAVAWSGLLVSIGAVRFRRRDLG